MLAPNVSPPLEFHICASSAQSTVALSLKPVSGMSTLPPEVAVYQPCGALAFTYAYCAYAGTHGSPPFAAAAFDQTRWYVNVLSVYSVSTHMSPTSP